MRAMRKDDGGAESSVSSAVALELLYRDHAPRLRRHLRARLGSCDEANDVIQEAFARLLGSSGRLQKPAAFLNRIVRNLLIDRSRRLAARPAHMPLEPDLEIAVRAEQSDRLELEQMRERYREAVDSLPERMRDVFLLHRRDGLGYREIAERLDISVRTVEGHFAKALVRIGRRLDRE